MAKGLVKLVVILAVVCAVAYFGANMFLEAFSQKALDYIVNNLKIPNLELTKPTFQGVGISSFNAVTWRGVTMAATIVRNEVKGQAMNATINIDALTIRVASIADGIVVLDLKGLTAALQESFGSESASAEQTSNDRMENGSMSIRMRLNISNPRAAAAQLSDLASEMRRFSEDGRTTIPVAFSADQIFTIKGRPYTLKMWVEKEGDYYLLLADPKDVEAISRGVVAYSGAGHGLEAGDIKVTSRNPIRAPMMLRIREKVATTAQNIKAAEPSYPEGAFRHVYWSYLLAKQYGPEFAREVGEAHHVGTADEADTEDFHNMSIGRQYFMLGYDESSIKDRVLNDPDVVRSH